MNQAQTRPFRPSLSSTFILVISVVVSCFLAHWQSGRIDEKIALQARYETMLKESPMQLNTLQSKDFSELSEKEWQPVSVSGQFLLEYQFLLDSQVYKGKPGYNVIVPLLITSSRSSTTLGTTPSTTASMTILVNRGWISAGADRTQIPNIPAITERQPIRGQLAKPKLAMPGFAAQDLDEQVQLFINMQALSDRIAAPLAPMIIQLDKRSVGPLPREWPKYQAKIEMHEFYVVHWLIVAFLSVLLYIYFAFKPKKILNL